MSTIWQIPFSELYSSPISKRGKKKRRRKRKLQRQARKVERKHRK